MVSPRARTITKTRTSTYLHRHIFRTSSSTPCPHRMDICSPRLSIARRQLPLEDEHDLPVALLRLRVTSNRCHCLLERLAFGRHQHLLERRLSHSAHCEREMGLERALLSKLRISPAGVTVLCGEGCVRMMARGASGLESPIRSYSSAAKSGRTCP